MKILKVMIKKNVYKKNNHTNVIYIFFKLTIFKYNS